MKWNLLLSVLFASAFLVPSVVAAPPRERMLLDFGWRFNLGDAPDAGTKFEHAELPRLDKARPDDLEQEQKLAAGRVDPVKTNVGRDVSFVQVGFDDAKWREVNVPHDWAITLPFDQTANRGHGYKPIGTGFEDNSIGWYRRTFELSPSDKGKAIWIEFDGVFRNSLVWLNGQCLGRHESGYSGFKYDISKLAKYDGKNSLVVRVDATRFEGWWYEGAGIYRHVWLVKTGPVHVAHWGTFVTSTPKGADAEVVVETTLRNTSDQPATVSLTSIVKDLPDTAATQQGVRLEPGAEQTAKQTLTIKAAKLWSLEDPHLYTLLSRVESGGGGATDEYETNFGVRTIAFDPDKGFFLNGKHVYLKGTCNHQDHAGVGVAIPDRLNVWRLERLKEMGCNAYRASHNPPTPELLDACDRLGILVMDEHRRMGATPELMGQLERLVRRDRNHPSIVMWSIGNEESAIQGLEEHSKLVAEPMQALVKKLDRTRPVTVAMNQMFGSGFSNGVEVQGFNYLKQGVRGKTSGRWLDIDQFRERFPAKVSLLSEEGSTCSTRGVYVDDKTKGYLAAYGMGGPGWSTRPWEWWTFAQQRPYLAGAFVWTGFDYRGEPTPYSWPCISSHFGIMDMCGFPKDIFYYYQAWWTDTPVLHVLPHWTWGGEKLGKEIDVWVHSNHDAVELLLDGQSLGKQPVKRNEHLAWKVKYEPGTLEARAYKGDTVAATKKVETAGEPARVELAPDRAEIDANGEDVSIVTVRVVDAQGRLVPDAGNLVRFDVTGGGTILGVGNGDPSSPESDVAPQRSAFNGLAQVIVQSGKTPGKLTLRARAEDLPDATTEINARSVTPRPAAR